MRKLLLIILMLLVGALAFVGITEGIAINSMELVSPYTDITAASEKLDKSIDNLNKITEVDFPSKQNTLKVSFENLEKAKEEYEDKLVFVTSQEQQESNILNSYDITFLITRIGKIATQNGLVIDLNVVQNATAQKISNVNYLVCDLSFSAVGSYIGITDFIYALEDDEQLEFAINSFKLVPNGENLCATFTVPEIPINSDNLLTTNTSVTTPNIDNDETISSNSSSSNKNNSSTNNQNNNSSSNKGNSSNVQSEANSQKTPAASSSSR